MKITLTAALLGALAILTSTAQASQAAANPTPFWVGTLWQNGEKPITIPKLFTSEDDCKSTLADVNDIAASTVHISRNHQCQSVWIDAAALRDYVGTQKH